MAHRLIFLSSLMMVLTVLPNTFQTAIASSDVVDVRLIIKEKVDPIVTGSRVTEDQLAQWRAAKARFLECGMCGDLQPFPEELPHLMTDENLVTGSTRFNRD